MFKRKPSANELFHKEMHEHYKELFETAVSELKYEKMNVSFLYSLIEELEVLWDDLVKAVIENGKNRHELDKIIHAKLLFQEE